ncbi:MAG: hypothetical protein AAF938_07245 [Myxococcota bacterium]
MSRIALLLALGGVALGALLPSHVSAQGWLADRSRAQGPGFRVGNLEIHPGLGIEAGYDSNLFYEDSNEDSSFLLRVTGHVLLSTLTQQRQDEGETEGDAAPKLRFNAGASASYFYFGNNRAGDNVSVDGFFDLTFNPEGRFVFRLYDSLGRSIRPFADAPPEGEAPRYGRVSNQAGADLTLQSDGRTLSATLGYRFDLDFFEDESFDQLNSFNHLVSLAFNWRFFPNTALVSRTEASFQNYYNESPTEPGALVVDNRRVRHWLGVNGAITDRIGFTAMVGSGAGFFENDSTDDFDNVLVHTELQYSPRRTVQLRLGYRRDFRSSFIGNFTRSNRIYLGGQVLVGSSFLLGAQTAVSFDQSGQALDPDGDALGNQINRSDTRFFANLFAEYRFTDWLALNASFGYTADFTDFVFNDPSTELTYPDAPAGFNKIEAWLGLRVFY